MGRYYVRVQFEAARSCDCRRRLGRPVVGATQSQRSLVDEMALTPDEGCVLAARISM